MFTCLDVYLTELIGKKYHKSIVLLSQNRVSRSGIGIGSVDCSPVPYLGILVASDLPYSSSSFIRYYPAVLSNTWLHWSRYLA